MPMKAQRYINKLRNDLYDPLLAKGAKGKAPEVAYRTLPKREHTSLHDPSVKLGVKGKATEVMAQAARRGGTRTAKTLMRVVPAVAGAGILGGYIGGRVHAGMKQRRKLLAQNQQNYEGMAGGGETVATVGEGPVMRRRGKRAMYTGKALRDNNLTKLAAIGNIVKGIGSVARQLMSDWSNAAYDIAGGNDLKADKVYDDAAQAADYLGDKISDMSQLHKSPDVRFNEIVDELSKHSEHGARIARKLKKKVVKS